MQQAFRSLLAASVLALSGVSMAEAQPADIANGRLLAETFSDTAAIAHE